MTLDPREVFQGELDALIDEMVEEARPEAQETVRRRLTMPGPINDKLCDLANDRMRDQLGDLADGIRQRVKDAFQ